jgi:hypothetical protein
MEPVVEELKAQGFSIIAVATRLLITDFCWNSGELPRLGFVRLPARIRY